MWILFSFLLGQNQGPCVQLRHPNEGIQLSTGERNLGSLVVESRNFTHWRRISPRKMWVIFSQCISHSIYMLTWLGYIDGKCYHIWHTYGSYGYHIPRNSEHGAISSPWKCTRQEQHIDAFHEIPFSTIFIIPYFPWNIWRFPIESIKKYMVLFPES